MVEICSEFLIGIEVEIMIVILIIEIENVVDEVGVIGINVLNEKVNFVIEILILEVILDIIELINIVENDVMIIIDLNIIVFINILLINDVIENIVEKFIVVD